MIGAVLFAALAINTLVIGYLVVQCTDAGACTSEALCPSFWMRRPSYWYTRMPFALQTDPAANLFFFAGCCMDDASTVGNCTLYGTPTAPQDL